jgi:hypothetical protein
MEVGCQLGHWNNRQYIRCLADFKFTVYQCEPTCGSRPAVGTCTQNLARTQRIYCAVPRALSRYVFPSLNIDCKKELLLRPPSCWTETNKELLLRPPSSRSSCWLLVSAGVPGCACSGLSSAHKLLALPVCPIWTARLTQIW